MRESCMRDMKISCHNRETTYFECKGKYSFWINKTISDFFCFFVEIFCFGRGRRGICSRSESERTERRSGGRSGGEGRNGHKKVRRTTFVGQCGALIYNIIRRLLCSYRRFF